MNKVNTFAEAATTLGFRGKKRAKKELKDRIVICPNCGKFMTLMPNTNVFLCTCDQYKLIKDS